LLSFFLCYATSLLESHFFCASSLLRFFLGLSFLFPPCSSLLSSLSSIFFSLCSVSSSRVPYLPTSSEPSFLASLLSPSFYLSLYSVSWSRLPNLSTSFGLCFASLHLVFFFQAMLRLRHLHVVGTKAGCLWRFVCTKVRL